MDEKQTLKMQVPISKINIELRTVWGWASVATKAGEPVVDAHGDIIQIDELVKAAHDFMAYYRTAKEMHQGDCIGEIVECAVITKDTQEAWGVDLGLEGMWIGMKIYDQRVWELFKNGTYKAFSIGGYGTRISE